MNRERKDIILSDKAKGKSFRLMTEAEICEAVYKLDGELLRDSSDGTYFLIHEPDRSELPSEVVLLLKSKEDKVIVTTQMHNHGIRTSDTIEPAEEAL